MKKLMRSLLAALLCVSSAHATTHTNRSFLMPRPVLRNKAMESTTWHKQINKKNHSKFGGSIEATPFYQRSENRHELGKYFGFYSTSDKTIHDAIEVGSSAIAGTSTDDLNVNDVYHNAAEQFVTTPANQGATTPFSGTLRLRPRQSVWGVRLDYFQDLEKLVNGLFFKVSTPIADIRNTMGATLESYKALATAAVNTTVPSGLTGTANNQAAAFTATNAADSTFNSTLLTGPATSYTYNQGDSNLGKTVADYFAGNVSQTIDPDKTAALSYAKIDGHHSTTELADIELTVGYNFVLKEDKHVGLNLAVVFPTGNKPKGIHLFEPIGGQGQCWAFGGGFDTAFTLWKSENKSLELLVGLDYRFVFENTQRRTLGLLKPDGTPSSHSFYQLMGQQGQSSLFPAANVLTMPVKVEPGSQVDAIAAFAFTCHNWVFDLGYNLYAQEAESVAVKSWAENTYGVANYFYATNKTGGFNITNTTGLASSATTSDAFFNGLPSAITKSQLDTNAASTPSQVTHKLYAGLGHTFNQWKYPLMISTGGSYEWSDNNGALEQWAAYGKIGVSF